MASGAGHLKRGNSLREWNFSAFPGPRADLAGVASGRRRWIS